MTSLIGLVSGVALAGCSEDGDGTDNGDNGGNDNNGGDSPAPDQEEYPDAWAYGESSGMVLRNVDGEVDSFSITITGDAINRSGQDYDYVSLEFRLYDDTDAKVGNALANISGLSDGQTWRFEAVGMESDGVETFQLEDITAY